MPLAEQLRREVEVIEPEGIDETWVRIGEEVTEQLEHKPGELNVRRIIRPKYALKRDLQLAQETSGEEGQEKAVKIAPLPPSDPWLWDARNICSVAIMMQQRMQP